MGASIGNSQDGDFGFQIAPMVDVVFVLLLFFMACAGMNLTEKHLAVALPSNQRTAIDPPIVLDIDPQGNVFANGEALDEAPAQGILPKLSAKVNQAVEVSSKTTIVIRPNAEARHARIVEVLNTCQKAGAKHVSFQ